VLVPPAEYNRLRKLDEQSLPAYPPADAQGNRPALETVTVSIARTLIRRRKEAGLSQQELADLAGVRQETICRLESGKHASTVRTLERIERALISAEKPKKKRR
jgi:DNA-binding XRE family transcriptional regulator